MKIYDKKLFKEGVYTILIVSFILFAIIRTNAFDLKKYSAYLFNTAVMYYLGIKTIIISLSEEKSAKENAQRGLAKTARKNIFGKKEPLVHILWVGMMVGSMPAVFYSLKLAFVMFLGGIGVLVWYIYVVEDEIKRIKNDVEFITEE